MKKILLVLVVFVSLVPVIVSAQENEPIYYGLPDFMMGKVFIKTRYYGDSTRFHFIEFPWDNPFENLEGSGFIIITSFDDRALTKHIFTYEYSPANQLITLFVSDPRQQDPDRKPPTFTMEFEVNAYSKQLVWRGPNYQNYLMQKYSKQQLKRFGFDDNVFW